MPGARSLFPMPPTRAQVQNLHRSENAPTIQHRYGKFSQQRRQPSLKRKHVAYACKALEAATPAPVYRLSHATVTAPAVHTCIIVAVVIAGAPARPLVNTGANVSFMSNDFVNSVGIACDTRNAQSASLADGTSVGITGCTPKLSVKLSSVLPKHKFLILPNLDGMDVVLGMDYLAANDATVHPRKLTVSLPSAKGTIVVNAAPQQPMFPHMSML